MSNHHRFMQIALNLARRNLGQTWPNPSVGAVIVKDEHIVGVGYTARGGRPHAEAQAIAQAGDKTKGATLYVTLEPCSHHGQTPPCVDALIQTGIAKAVIACRDPHPQVNGQGIAKLQAAGIEVIEGICAKEATDIHRGFFSVIEKKRPYIALKIATSMDGKIATASGQSQWITGERARAYGHLLRSRYDAIAIGIGTILADDPLLTCRLPGLEDRSPVRVVFDRQNRLPQDSQLAKTAGKVPVWIISTTPSPSQGEGGVRITYLHVQDTPHLNPPPERGRKNKMLEDSMHMLAQKGITRLLVEAGSALSTVFLHSGLVDRVYWFRAPMVIGNDGLSAIGSGFSAALDTLVRWQHIEHIPLQPDSLDIFECSPASSAP